MEINNRITPRVEPSFQAIQRCCKLGTFSRGFAQTDKIENALNKSEVLQKYCKDNDIHMIISADRLTYCKKNLWYASLDLMKIFPKPKLNLFEKVVNVFKKQPREAVVFRSYGDGRTMAINKLIEYIDSIKNERDLQGFISYKKRNPVVMDKCKSCGWNSEYIYF